MNLGQELQLLLKIPPISKKNDTDTSSVSFNNPITNNLPQKSNVVNFISETKKSSSNNSTTTSSSTINTNTHVAKSVSQIKKNDGKDSDKQQQPQQQQQHGSFNQHHTSLDSNSSIQITKVQHKQQPIQLLTKLHKDQTDRTTSGQQQQQQQSVKKVQEQQLIRKEPQQNVTRNDIKPLMKSIPFQENQSPINQKITGNNNNSNNSNNSSSSNEGPQTLLQLLKRTECPRDLTEEADMLCENAYRERNGQSTSQGLRRLLSAHGIEVLSKKSSKFPKAKFICNSCNYHLDSTYACIHHILGPRHSTFEFMKNLEYTLEQIPHPSRSHCISVGNFLSSVFEKYALSEQEVARRKQYVARLNEDLKALNIGCTLTLFGSSFSSLGFKDSDININISITPDGSSENVKPSGADNLEILQRLFVFFQHHPSSMEVKKMVSSKSATIVFIERESRCEVTMSMNNNAGVETARLFAEYVQINPLVRPLVIAFRMWAKFCEVDNQDKGSLPPHAFTVMVIYFLQQVNILPNLHHIRYQSKEEEDPEDEKFKDFSSAREARKYWSSHVSKLPGLVWLEMFRFWALEFNYRELVVSISQQVVYRSDKYWNRKLSVEDPVIPKSNLSRSMPNNRMCEYILERFKFTYLYFGVPRTIRGSFYDGIIYLEDERKCRSHVYHKIVSLIKNVNDNNNRNKNQDLVKNNNLEKITNPKWDPMSIIEEIRATKQNNSQIIPPSEIASTRVRMYTFIGNDNKEKNHVFVDDAKIFEVLFPDWLLDYKFETQFLQNGIKPPIICKSCGNEGHLKSDCPDEILPKIKPVLNATPDSLRLLNDVIISNFKEESLNEHDTKIRLNIIDQLQQVLLPIYPEAQLSMFGSTYNGFGAHRSDVDICLTFRNSPASKTEGVNGINILKIIEEKLKTVNFLQEVIAIPSAKVPIIKFRHKECGLEGDISFYNTLAMHNTHLLRTYAEKVDVRVKIIGCFLKKLTKLCDISDASRGSLSSYGYVLMVIHYFQHLAVPVLPVLQELCRDQLLPIMVDGCDVQYFKDIENLHHVWPLYGKNRQSLSELWLGFLNYYTETFNFDEHVVTISQFAPLSRISKLWLTDAIAVEDPFERHHNLGSGLSKRMSVHILKTFQHLREVFHRSYDANVLKKNMNWLGFYTDPKSIKIGEIPLERLCRICKKIGHFARNCVTPSLNDLVAEKVKVKNREKSNPKTTKTALTEINQFDDRREDEQNERRSSGDNDQIKNFDVYNKQSSPDGVTTNNVLQTFPMGSQPASNRPNNLPTEDQNFPR